MFGFNEQIKKANNQHKAPTCDNLAGRPAQLRSFIERLKLKPSGAFNIKLKQPAQQLCAKLNHLHYGQLKNELHKSLGKFAPASERTPTGSARTRSSCGGVIVASHAPTVGGKKRPATPRLERSFSVNSRWPLVRTVVVGHQQPATAIRRNEWATASLQQASAAAAVGVAICQRSSENDYETKTSKRPVAHAVKQQQRQQREPLAARLMKWPLLAGGGGGGGIDGRDYSKQQKSAPKRLKQQQHRQPAPIDCEKSRAQSIVSLLSSAAASSRRRETKRTVTSDHLTKMPFALVTLFQLLIVLVSLLAPLHPVGVNGAPISQFLSLKPIWLADGLMDVSGSSSLDQDASQLSTGTQADGDGPYQATSEDREAALAGDLLERVTSIQQQQQQQQGEQDANESQVSEQAALDYLAQQQGQHQTEPLLLGPPERSWFLLSSEQERMRAPPSAQIGLPYAKRPEDAAREVLWIERRRLNRDRALEPPAWLRTRPIRRGSWPADGHSGTQAARAQARDSAAGPMRRRSSRGRQLRESTSETYDQILRHLLEEALENGSLLAELYGELEARATIPQQRPGAKMTQLEAQMAGATGQPTTDDKSAARQQEGQEGTLVVAGDEISSEDDVTPVDLSMVVAAQAEPALSVSEGDQSNRVAQVPAQQQQQQQPDRLAQLPEAGGKLLMRSPAEVTSIEASGSPVDSALIELMKQTGPLDQQHQEPSFYVIEDIDQVDSSEEAIQQQDQQQQPGGEFGGSAPQDTTFRLDKRSIELDSAFVGDFKEDDEHQVGSQHHDQLAGARQTQRMLVARRAPFGRAMDQLLEMQVQGQEGAGSQQPPAGPNRSLAATAIRLIRSGYFTRAQLIQFATKLRVFLEDRLGLARDTIVGLFPIDKQRLIVELNPARLTRNHLQMIMRTYDFSRKSNSLVLSWPSETASLLHVNNPLPILTAILDALYDEGTDETTGARYGDYERMQFEEARGDAQPTMGVQINELPPTASALVARDLSQQLERDQHQKGAEVEQQQQQQQQEQQEEPDGRDEKGEQIQSLLMSPGGDAPRYVQTQAPQLSEAPAPSPFGREQQLQLALPPTQSLDQYYKSRRRVALLASYLSALYGLDQQQQQQQQLVMPAEYALWEHELAAGHQQDLVRGGVAGNATLSEVGVVSTPAIYQRLLAALGFDSLAASALTSLPQQSIDAHEKPPTPLWSHHLLAIVLALAVTFVIVKLILKRLDTTKRYGNRRRLSTMTGSSSTSTFCDRAQLCSSSRAGKWWAPWRKESFESAGANADPEDAPDTIKGVTLARADKQHPLGKAFAGFAPNQKHKPSSTDSGLDGTTLDGTEQTTSSSSEKIRRSFEHLTRRLTRLLSLMRSDQQQLQKLENAELATALEGAGLKPEKGMAAHPECQQQFRSSTSYIRSLIEALTKAASAQMAATGKASTLNDDDDDEDDEDSDKLALLESAGGRAAKQQQPEQVFQPECDDTEIHMAQMDISAAHLILDYMEKHLVDKERLRREWLELNGAACTTPLPTNNGRGPAQPGTGTSLTTSKANQLVLQRLAKIALNEDNYHKNRNPNVVPFDRNRVRLGSVKRAGAIGCEPPSGPAPIGSRPKLRNQRNGRNGSKNSAGLDYINASFIHDDDPRRATLIIAQGPKEQTCGQFWQMVWEQEISVIVMLTRLNENSAQMCHCYWPTQIGSAHEGDTADAGGKPELSPPPSSLSGARRGSVTSVFSGLAGTRHPNSSAIVAGALNDSALYFELALSTSSTSGSGSRQTSRSSAEDDPDEAKPQDGASANKKRQEGVAGKTLKLELRLISEHLSSSDYLVRNMYLINRATGETRTISQFHYLAWQEGKTPESVRSFLQFRRKVHKSYRNLESPILVHCSDGAGRSGTYALIDIILERIRNGAKEIDLRATLEHLRDQRIGLCENQAQFEFVLVALAEEIQMILNALPR